LAIAGKENVCWRFTPGERILRYSLRKSLVGAKSRSEIDGDVRTAIMLCC